MTIRRSVAHEFAYAVRSWLGLTLLVAAKWVRVGVSPIADLLVVASWTCLPEGLRGQVVERPLVTSRWARNRIWALSPGMADEITRRRMGAGS